MKTLFCSLTLLFLMTLTIVIPIKVFGQEPDSTITVIQQEGDSISINFLSAKVLDAISEMYGKKIPNDPSVELTLTTINGVEYSFFLRFDYPSGKVRYLKCRSNPYVDGFHIYMRYNPDQNEKPFIVVFSYDCPYYGTFVLDSMSLIEFRADSNFREIGLDPGRLKNVCLVYYRITDKLPWELKTDLEQLFPKKK